MAIRQQPEWVETVDESEGDAGWHNPQRRLQHQVEIQSRQIDQVLSRHEIEAGVGGGSVRSHWVSFDLVGQLSGGWDRLRRITGQLTGEIAAALGVPEVRLERQNGVLRLAVRRQEPHPVDLLDLLDLLPEASDLNLALGLDHQGQPVMLNLNQPDLHNILVAGVSGAGKSSLMRSMAISLALTCRQSQAQLAVIGLGSAPSGIARRPNPLYPVNYLPHLLFPVATEVDEAIEALAYLVEEVAYRADNQITSPALVILVDDADMLLRRVGGAVADQLATLLNAPAEASVRVVVGASNPGLPTLWQMLHHNVDLRLVGRMADERAAQAATGLDKSYAQYLDGKGDFIAVSAAGIEPFQAAHIDDYDLHLTLTELHRASAPILLAQAMEGKESLPPSWSSAEPQGFTYDATNGRATMEPDDRAARNTVEGALEIAVEPVGGRRAPGGLSWLDQAEMGGFSGGLALPLAGQMADEADDPVAQAMASYQSQWEAFAAGDQVEDEEDDGWMAGIPELADEDDEELEEVEDEAPVKAPGNSAADMNGLAGRPEEGYEMLPFDDDGEDEQPETNDLGPAIDRLRPAAEERPASAPARAAGPGVEALPNSERKPIIVSPERAQTLWPVEPIYTDIEDDLWDAPDEDDDWRKRLH